MSIDWSNYPSFTQKELACKHCGADGIRHELMDVLQSIRFRLDRPIFISSGYRCVNHPAEQEKDKKGEHTLGLAVDVLCHGVRALEIIKLAQDRGIKRIGVHQKGNPSGRFIHLGIADQFTLSFPAGIWTY
jgi:uncharacterized protein YcbK (DUF882 family)